MDRFNKKIISLLIFLILGYPMYSGKWIRGDYKDVEYDRIIEINNHLRDLSNFIDENLKKNDQYIYIINGSVYEFYNINNSEYYRGQDLLPKLQRKTILYNDNIDNFSFKKNLSKIENSNYFVYRRDLRNKNLKLEDFEINIENLNKIYSNDLYDLFERKNKTSLFFKDIDLKYNLSWLFLFKINGSNPYIKISNNHEFYFCKIDNYAFMNLLNELLLCNTKYKKSDNSFYRFDNLEKNNTYIFFNSIQMKFFKLSLLSLLLIFFLLSYLYVQRKK